MAAVLFVLIRWEAISVLSGSIRSLLNSFLLLLFVTGLTYCTVTAVYRYKITRGEQDQDLQSDLIFWNDEAFLWQYALC